MGALTHFAHYWYTSLAFSNFCFLIFQRGSKKQVDQTKKSEPVQSLGYKKKRRRYEQKMMHLFIPLSQKLQSSQADLFTEFKKKTVLEVKFTNSTNFPLAKKSHWIQGTCIYIYLTWKPKFSGIHMGVSKNRVTSKWMVYNGNLIKMDGLGVPPF